MKIVILVLSILFIRQSVSAEKKVVPKDLVETCRKSLQKYCNQKSYEIEKKDIVCLYKFRKQLDKTCLVNVPKIAAVFGTCQLEIIAYCPSSEDDSVQHNFQCLIKSRKNHLPACGKLVDSLQEKNKKAFDSTIDEIAKSCAVEYTKCGDPSDFQARACLTKLYKEGNVSAGCRSEIDLKMQRKKP